MTNNKDFPAELNPRKSSSSPVKKSSNQEQKYIETLETEKVDLLAKVDNYIKEQKARVVVFKDQEKLLDQKEQQLISKDEELVQKEEAITKLKTRISELAKELNFLKKFDQVNEETETTETATQTIGTSPEELEEALLEKRVENLKDFGSYQEKLKAKENEITQLTNQISVYQQQIRKLISQPNQNRNKLFILTILLIITTSLLLFK